MTKYTENTCEEYKTRVPEGIDGEWKVERFQVTEEDEKFERMRAAFSFGSRGRFVPAGLYTRLMRNGWLVMSDTPDEIRDHLYAIAMAKGEVLVHGLGLGVYVEAVLRKPEVEHVTVVEIAPEVVRLVGSYLQDRYGDKLEIVEGDALTWVPPKGKRYGAVWHDIWDDLCSDNLPEMHRLHRRYGRRCDWQGSWGRERCEWMR